MSTEITMDRILSCMPPVTMEFVKKQKTMQGNEKLWLLIFGLYIKITKEK